MQCDKHSVCHTEATKVRMQVEDLWQLKAISFT